MPSKRRHEITVGVSYDADLDQAAGILRRAVEAVYFVDKDRRIDVFVRELAASSVDFR